MNRLFLIFCFSVVSGLASAEYQLPSIDEIKTLINKKYEILGNDSKCENLSKIAKPLMEERQIGLSLDSQFRSVDNGTFPDDMKQKERQIILQAHALPIFDSDSSKTRAAIFFQNKVFLECREKGLNADWDILK